FLISTEPILNIKPHHLLSSPKQRGECLPEIKKTQMNFFYITINKTVCPDTSLVIRTDIRRRQILHADTEFGGNFFDKLFRGNAVPPFHLSQNRNRYAKRLRQAFLRVTFQFSKSANTSSPFFRFQICTPSLSGISCK